MLLFTLSFNKLRDIEKFWKFKFASNLISNTGLMFAIKALTFNFFSLTFSLSFS